MAERVLASCHCGAVELELTLPHGFEKMRRCNCSMCSRRGAVAASVALKNLRVAKGAEALCCYSFGTHTAKHYFCGTCGIYTHHQRRSDPTEYGFNIACVPGVKIEDYLNVGYVDGRDDHPSDRS